MRNIPFAQQAAAAIAPINPLSEKSDYSGELQHLTNAAESGKAQNPVSYGAGAVAGTLAPLAIPGAGEAMAATYPAAIASNAGLSAAQSLSDTNLTNPSGDALKQALIAAGIGGTIGAAGKYLTPAKALAPEAAAPEASAPIAKGVSVEAPPEIAAPNGNVTEVGGRAIPNKPVAKDFTPSAERARASMLVQGVGGMPRQWRNILGKDPVQAANEILTWSETADNGKSLVKLFDRPGELLAKTNKIHDESGKIIGDIVDKVGGKISVGKRELLDNLQPIYDESFMNPKARTEIGGLMEEIEKADEAGRLDFNGFNKLKSVVGKEAGRVNAEPAAQRAYGVMAQYGNDHVDRLARLVNDPAVAAKYAKAKIDYHKI